MKRYHCLCSVVVMKVVRVGRGTFNLCLLPSVDRWGKATCATVKLSRGVSSESISASTGPQLCAAGRQNKGGTGFLHFGHAKRWRNQTWATTKLEFLFSQPTAQVNSMPSTYTGPSGRELNAVSRRRFCCGWVRKMRVFCFCFFW